MRWIRRKWDSTMHTFEGHEVHVQNTRHGISSTSNSHLCWLTKQVSRSFMLHILMGDLNDEAVVQSPGGLIITPKKFIKSTLIVSALFFVTFCKARRLQQPATKHSANLQLISFRVLFTVRIHSLQDKNMLLLAYKDSFNLHCFLYPFFLLLFPLFGRFLGWYVIHRTPNTVDMVFRPPTISQYIVVLYWGIILWYCSILWLHYGAKRANLARILQ